MSISREVNLFRHLVASVLPPAVLAACVYMATLHARAPPRTALCVLIVSEAEVRSTIVA
ncbi:hypothetical protein J6590_066129, partial [Homalodisca vitripennis]